MGNRKQPFGYKITLGEVAIHIEEARVVKQIFKQYLLGESLQKLADTLQEQGVVKVAAEQFAALGDEEYETIRLRRQFTAATEPSAELLKSTVAEVVVD